MILLSEAKTKTTQTTSSGHLMILPYVVVPVLLNASEASIPLRLTAWSSCTASDTTRREVINVVGGDIKCIKEHVRITVNILSPRQTLSTAALHKMLQGTHHISRASQTSTRVPFVVVGDIYGLAAISGSFSPPSFSQRSTVRCMDALPAAPHLLYPPLLDRQQ